jgi:hypothetical protein
LSQPGQALSLANILCLVIAVVGIVAVIDPITDSFFTHDLFSDLTGFPKGVVGRPDYRMGIRRAAGTLEHPILLGASTMIALLFAVGLKKLKGRWFVIVGSTLGLLASVSSAPIQAAVFGLGLMMYDRILRQVKIRWKILVGLLLAALAAIFLGFGSPLGFVNEHLVFDSGSGYSRQFEWATVGQYVSQSPIFGIGYGWASIAEKEGAFTSIDSLWLGLSLVYGIPCAVLIGLCFIGSTTRPSDTRLTGLSREESKLATLLSIVMGLLVFLAFTVYFWGSFWVLSAMLAGMRAHLGELGQLTYVRPRNPRPSGSLAWRPKA